MEARSLVLAIVAALIVTVSAQQCERHVTCESCISSSPQCVWCRDNSTDISVRCYDRNRPITVCSNIEDPQSRVDGKQGILTEDNFVIPRTVNITLRPGISTSFNVTVQSARNFPLDLYLLIDVSASLSDDVTTLRSLSSNITESLSNISSNYKIGFGTFVDKNTFPYSPAIGGRDSDGNCRSYQDDCVTPYSFRHILSLTDDEDEFSNRLDATANTSFNADVAEAGFDSILQAVVCQNVIGWRDRATRIVLYISDAISHIAGDGRLAGIVRPNDGTCGLTLSSDGQHYEYSHWANRDYASFGLLEEKLRDEDVVAILAVDAGAQNYYKEMIKNSNRMFFSLLERSSTNIINIIETQYEILVGTIFLEPVPIPGIRVSVQPLDGCNNIGSSGECKDVSVEQTVVFSVTVTADRCIQPNSSFEVRVRGFGRIVVGVQPLCNCDCEKNAIVNSSRCRDGAGTYVCGVCVCGDAETGVGTFGCPTGVVSNAQCSGHGQCTTCGICQCERVNANDLYFGSACECDTFSCGRNSMGQACGGNGQCCNGSCMCSVNSQGEPLFTGSQCGCTTNNRTCLNERNVLCSDHGTCTCGVCQCTSSDYSGRYCDNCVGESCQPCNIYSNCVLCDLGSTSIDCNNCSQISLVTQDDDFANATLCTIRSGDCDYQYMVRQDDTTGNYMFFINKANPVCIEPNTILSSLQSWWWIVIAILVPILIIILGIIILIIIKVCVVLKDKRELKKFQNEVQDAAWADTANPLYVTPVSEYPNLAYKPKNK